MEAGLRRGNAEILVRLFWLGRWRVVLSTDAVVAVVDPAFDALDGGFSALADMLFIIVPLRNMAACLCLPL